MDQDIEQLIVALNSVKALRSNVRSVFESLSSGLRADHGDEGKEKKFILELQDLLTLVNNNLRDVENAVSTLSTPPGPLTLGNSTHLAQEPTLERQQLYSQLVNSYKWTDNIREYAAIAAGILSSNSFNKTYKTFGRKPQTSNHNVPSEVIENLITGIDRIMPDVTINCCRPFVANPIIRVSFGRVIIAVIVFKGLLIECVIIKALGESPSLWTESRYRVMRKVNENCHVAMLHFHSPQMPELAVTSFMHWLHSYVSLFNAPCKKCGNHMRGTLPPTWRDLRMLEPYHEECK